MNQLAWTDGSKPERSEKKDKPIKQEVCKQEVCKQDTFQPITTKREAVSNKLSERELIGNGNYNPFLAGNTYIDDLDVQQNFLIPRSSHEK